MFSEQRRSARKVLKVKAVLALEGKAPVAVRTLDIGANGMCLAVASPLHAGEKGQIAFELFVDGKAQAISVRSTVSYCILSNGEFKAGFQFVNLDLASMTVLVKFLR